MVGTITVVNKKIDPDHVYIGRGSILGNPFVMRDKSHGERTRVIEQYRNNIKTILRWYEEGRHNDLVYIGSNNHVTVFQYMNELHRLYSELINGKNIKLGCFCAPQECHGDVIKELLEYWLRRK